MSIFRETTSATVVSATVTHSRSHSGRARRSQVVKKSVFAVHQLLLSSIIMNSRIITCQTEGLSSTQSNFGRATEYDNHVPFQNVSHDEIL